MPFERPPRLRLRQANSRAALYDRWRRSLRAAHKTTCERQVWQEGSHPQAIVSDEIMLQKLDYLHNNPVKRGLVASPEHWRYSSAHEWLGGASPVLRCDPWR